MTQVPTTKEVLGRFDNLRLTHILNNLSLYTGSTDHCNTVVFYWLIRQWSNVGTSGTMDYIPSALTVQSGPPN